ncbi:MAG: PQQ-binding-like beta-propeller repeat protein [Verrucomicrobiales bacterium]|jgi:outer membrane protein assembly factor BamB|nr:PQQ-binding-like beta-propeller repeat protein [Verrucomicrobiales bacterium]
MKIASFFILIFTVSNLCGEDWTQWRGPNRDGVAGGKKWPVTLKESNLNLKWRVKLGSSYSGALLDKDTVYVTESVGANKNDVVQALDRATGKVKWKQQWPGTGKWRVTYPGRVNGSWIRSTPALANGKLFVAGMHDNLLCLETETGKKIWEINFPKQFKTSIPGFGCVCSPMVDGKFVYMQAGASFCKIDQASGKIIWRTMKGEGGLGGGGFSSPVFATLDKKRQILIQARTELAGIDIDSGAVLWRQPVKAYLGMNILTPLPYEDGIFTGTYRAGSYYYEINQVNEAWTSREKWKNGSKSSAYMSSPVLFEGHAYLLIQDGNFACYDLKTGEECWRSDKQFGSGRHGKYMSLVRQGDQILALDQGGTLHLIKANPEKFQIIDSKKVSEQPTWGHLAVSDNQLAVRELNGIAFYDWKSSKPIIP